MQQIYNTLVESYLQNKVGITEHFLSDSLAGHLVDNLNDLFDEKKLVDAGTGNQLEPLQNKSIRSDRIYWLDRAHNDLYENEFFLLMDDFVEYLNRTCFTGITGYEFHYTLYEEGTFYLKHLDQFRNNKSRQYSMILYLNPEWEVNDGGELCVHFKDRKELITPTLGKSVFFKSSELLHEVLLNHKPRMSITGWLKVD